MAYKTRIILPTLSVKVWPNFWSKSLWNIYTWVKVCGIPLSLPSFLGPVSNCADMSATYHLYCPENLALYSKLTQKMISECWFWKGTILDPGDLGSGIEIIDRQTKNCTSITQNQNGVERRLRGLWALHSPLLMFSIHWATLKSQMCCPISQPWLYSCCFFLPFSTSQASVKFHYLNWQI